MQKKKIKIYVQVVVALFFVTINIIEFIRPITNWPVPVEIIDDIQNEMIASMNI